MLARKDIPLWEPSKLHWRKKQIFDHFQLRGKQVTGGWVGGKSQMGMTKTAGVDDRKEDSPWAQETGCHRAERQSSPVGRVADAQHN